MRQDWLSALDIRSLLSSTLTLIVALLTGTLAGAIFVKAHYDLPEGPTAMKQFLEEYGLNLLGDTIAGFLGLATLVVVVITYFAQKAMAKQTVMEMQQQNAIAKAVARANYKLSLFDKRSSVYQELNEVSMMVMTSGTFEHDAHARFVRAGLAAKNIFGDHKEIEEWVDRLLFLGRKIRPLHHSIERYENLQGAGTFGEREQEKLNEYRQKLAERNMELLDAYDWTEMDRLFLPFLKLDTDIVIEEIPYK